MKYSRIVASVASAAMLGISILPTNVFASNTFGIDYKAGSTHGSELSQDNVTIDPDRINGLTPLLQVSEATAELSGSWKTGYEKHGNSCVPVNYFKVPKGGVGEDNDLRASFLGDNYRIDVKINKAEADLAETIADGKGFSVSVINEGPKSSSFIYSGHEVFTDSGCSDSKKVSDIVALDKTNNNKSFVSVKAKLYKKNSDTIFKAKELYFGITDIDAAQSYKILNPNNQLNKNNMLAKSERVLQFDEYNGCDPDAASCENPPKCALESDCDNYKNVNGLRNMFVSDGNYIYSQYKIEGKYSSVASPQAANVFVGLEEETQEDGLDIVFGFNRSAGSGIEYYAQQYNVTYSSDENGKIPDGALTSETLISGDVATGSTAEPNEGYEFSHWIADTDVTLTDGKTIKAGDPITDEEVKKVVVDKNIAFTAINEALEPEDEGEDEEEGGVIAVPDTGASTKDINAILIPASIFGILVGALIIRALPRLLHKKVNFNK